MTRSSGFTLGYQVEHVTQFEGDIILTWLCKLIGGQTPKSMIPHLPALFE